MNELNKLLNVDEVSKILGIDRKTLYQWKWQKRHLPFIKVGRVLRVSERDLDEFIRKGKISPK